MRPGNRTGVGKRFLLDTGFLVALADSRERQHHACLDVWRRLAGQCLTVEGVLVEAAYMVSGSRGGAAAVIGIVHSVATEVIAPTQERYERVLELMARYANVPMDFVDALLVAVAEERSVETVLSLDRRGFGTYRIRGRRHFNILP